MIARNTIRVAAVAGLMMAASAIQAGEKKLMHCFAFTPVKTATEADWSKFYATTDALPSKIPGITKVWHGKLARPLALVTPTKISDDDRKKMMAGEAVNAEVKRVVREYGVCMEMTDEAALKAYDSAPYHKDWSDAYSKVRVEGTTTYNILGQ